MDKLPKVGTFFRLKNTYQHGRKGCLWMVTHASFDLTQSVVLIPVCPCAAERYGQAGHTYGVATVRSEFVEFL